MESSHPLSGNNFVASSVFVHKDQCSDTRKFRLSASFWEATRIAVDSLRKNKLRSFLTLLGIILATTTLIAVTALIHGMNLYIAEKVSNMGSDGFRVVRMAWFGPWDPKKFFEMKKRNPQIRPDEYEFVKRKRHSAQRRRHDGVAQRARLLQGRHSRRRNVQGVTDNIPAINNVQVDIGRGITYEEVRRHAPVAFIGNDLRDALLRRARTPSARPSRSKATRTKWWAWPKRWAASSATRRTTSS